MIKRLLILTVAWPFALGAAEVTPSAICAERLSSFDADVTARLKLTPDFVAFARQEDPALVRGLTALLSSLDNIALDRIAMAVIENPVDYDAREVAENAFYLAHPELRRRFGDKTLINFGTGFGQISDPYELGLLSYLVPDSPRVDEARLDGLSHHVLFRKTQEQIDRLAKSNVYGPALSQLLRRYLASCGTLHDIDDFVGLMLKDKEALKFDFPELHQTLDRFDRGRVSKRDGILLIAMVQAISDGVMRHAGFTRDDAVEMVLDFKNDLDVLLAKRVDLIDNLERYLAAKLKFTTSIDRLVTVITAVSSLDPLPVPNAQLRQGILARAETLLSPLRLKYRATVQAKPAVAPGPTREIPKFELNLTDHFAPRPTGHRRSTTAAIAVEPRSNAGDGAPAIIDAERRLRDWTSFADQPRPIEALTADQTYAFWYIREAEPVLRRVRFGPEAIAWFNQHPTLARQMLNAIHLGASRGTTTGFKTLQIKSRKYTGPLFEVKLFARYRPLALLVDGTWQIIKVSHKDDFERDALWLAPLEPRS